MTSRLRTLIPIFRMDTSLLKAPTELTDDTRPLSYPINITVDAAKFSENVMPICTTTLDRPPSCIEFSPIDTEYFVVGTYQLEKENYIHPGHDSELEVSEQGKPQFRTGSLDLFRIVDQEL
jgi:hypothetical protein